MPFSIVEAAPLRYDSISSDTTWSSDQTLTTDVVVQSGARLTIEDITVTANAFDSGGLYGGGLSTNKIEVIVENGGELVVEPGAILTAASAGDWYGVVFLPGSGGSVTSAVIEYGTVGVTIQGASPIISGTTIADMQGDDGPNWSSPGEMAAGIVISGTCTSQVISNTIEIIAGGNGQAGADGFNGSGGGTGSDGDDGGKGGDAYGIWVQGGATPTVSNNIIKIIHGGAGGDGGDGGDGNGCTGLGDGACGGAGGDAGAGGEANGIYIDAADCSLSGNTLIDISGGAGGHGGSGGGAALGCAGDSGHPAGGAGGTGGSAGDGGDGGVATGIKIVDASPTAQDNNILSDWAITIHPIAGGAGGSAGTPQNGLAGGDGYAPGGGSGAPGGDGGNGGGGGDGGKGGDGGGASGIFVYALSGSANPWLVHNNSSGIILGGPGGDGSDGANGGNGGNGGDGDSNVALGGDGGVGGAGGSNGSGGKGGDGGVAVGIYSLGNQAEPVLLRNSTAAIKGNDAGSAGDAGTGGDGGVGGDGGNGTTDGDGGDGGDGGSASGSLGGGGGWGGDSYGIMLLSPDVLVQNNLAHTIAGGQGSGGGDGGTGGDGGNGGTGDANGSGGDGGDGGNGGSGGNIGEGKGIHVYTTTYVYNNTINDVVSGSPGVLAGGAAGWGGVAGTPSGSTGAPGFSGGAGSPGYGYGIYIASGLPKLVNNIVSYVPAGSSSSTIKYGIYSAVSILGVNIDRDFNDVYDWDTNYYQISSGTHDIHQDPLFEDRLNRDYHLKSNSPCIDAGDDGSYSGMGLPTEDIDFDSRPDGPKYDIGADEFVTVSPSGVTIAGPMQGEIKTGYAFTATVAPASTTTPLTYTWQADDQSTATVTGTLSSSTVFTWTTIGRKTITVTVANVGGQETSTRVIQIGHQIYLPLVLRSS
jgi:hypothetical protein